jgi:hypothetical protein
VSAFAAGGTRWLAMVAGLSLAASAVLAVFGDAFDVASSGADAFSRSALGHHAVAELWRALGRRVLVSRHHTASKLSESAVLVVAEPLLGDDRASGEKLSAMLAASSRTLLVLPKRVGAPDPLRPRWIGRQFVLPKDEVAKALKAAGIEGDVLRSATPISAWRGDYPLPALDEPQLVRSAALTPLLSTSEGILLGLSKQGNGLVIVLSDPDVIATHGLGRGDNALLAARLLERLTGGEDAAVVVDETLHGHEQEPSLARELMRWPLVLATLQAAFALALMAWAALIRFGRPRRDAPALASGKAFLVENTADLLRHGGHGGPALAAYWRAAKEHVAYVLRAPGAAADTLDAWLARLAAARGRASALDALERRVAALSRERGGDELARAALAIHDFREEMTHGADPHP